MSEATAFCGKGEQYVPNVPGGAEEPACRMLKPGGPVPEPEAEPEAEPTFTSGKDRGCGEFSWKSSRKEKFIKLKYAGSFSVS